MIDIEISFDLSRIDFRRTSDLIMASYWGETRTDEMNKRAFAHSVCAAAYRRRAGCVRPRGHRLLRLCLSRDVIVWPEHRGKGIGKTLVRACSTIRTSRRYRTGA